MLQVFRHILLLHLFSKEFVFFPNCTSSVLMSKNRDSSQRSARALKHLEAHNKSPKGIVESEESDGNQNQPREDSSHRRSGSRSHHRSMEVEERSCSRSQASSRHEHSKSRRRKDKSLTVLRME